MLFKDFDKYLAHNRSRDCVLSHNLKIIFYYIRCYFALAHIVFIWYCFAYMVFNAVSQSLFINNKFIY